MKEEKIIRFLNNQSFPEEKEEVLRWLDQPGAEQELEEIFQDRWENDVLTAAADEAPYVKMLDKIHHATTDKKKGGTIINRQLRWTGIAASFSLLMLAAYFVLKSWEAYEPSAEPVSLIEKKTDAGEKLTFTLPDQSTVVLNSLSSIKFDSDFGKTERVVHLEGEGFFEVRSDKNRPFVVQAQEVTTTALGTAFNIASRDGKVKVALTEGKVLVSYDRDELELNSGKMALLDHKGDKGLELAYFDSTVTTAWKEGKISFKSQTIGDILSNLEDWYGVEFTVKGKIDLKRKVTGLFDNNNLEDILNGLSFSLNLEYRINGTEVVIQPQRL